MDPKFMLMWMDLFRESSLRVLSGSSSSSNRLQQLVLMVMLTMMESCLLLQEMKREWWTCPRENTFWSIMEQQVWKSEPEYRDVLYRHYYRMRFSLFESLLSEIEQHISCPTQYVREPVQPSKALCLVLHRLGHGTPTYVLSELYGVGESTVRKYTMIIVDIIIQHLQNKYIVIPTGSRLQTIMSDFQSLTLLPTICGAIGGTHIKLSYAPASKYNPKSYINQQRFYSVLLQGIYDTQKVFWNVCVNAPGGSTYAEHWKNSDIKECIQKREVLASPSIQIGGRVIHPLLLANSAYPISSTILTPYNNDYSELVVLFDKFLLCAHAKIESTFGILKARWGILQNMGIRLENVPKLVVACCVLHNFVQINGETEPDAVPDSDPNFTMPLYPDPTESQLGEMQRNALFEEWLRQYLLSRVDLDNLQG